MRVRLILRLDFPNTHRNELSTTLDQLENALEDTRHATILNGYEIRNTQQRFRAGGTLGDLSYKNRPIRR